MKIQKSKYFKFIIGLLFVILAAPVSAQLGELGINPLLIEGGVRPLGMGGAYASVSDLNSAVYNPGGLAWAKGISLSLKDVNNVYAVQAYPTGFSSSLGLLVVNKNISDIPISSGVANSVSNVVSVSYGTKLSFIPAFSKSAFFERFGIGLNVKGLMGQTLRRTGQADRSATGWDLDLGMLWKAEEWWNVGVSLQNVLSAGSLGGGTIKWDTGAVEGIPALGKLAVSAKVIGDMSAPIYQEDRELALAGELDFARSKPLLLRLGGEFSFKRQFYVRTGFMQQNKASGSTSDITFGLGIKLKDWDIGMASYVEPVRNQRTAAVSVVYFPKDWVVVKELDIAKPAMVIKKPIEMISLEDNVVTYEDKIDIFGKAKPGVEIYVNGHRAYLSSDNSFKVMVPLQMQKNLVLVEARYGGEKKVWKYKVLRKARIVVAEEAKIEKEIEAATTPEEKKILVTKKRKIEEKKEKVEALVTMGVIEVTPEAEFVMEAGITRGELSSWIVKAAELRLPTVDQDLYPDIPYGHPLASYIKVVTELKLLQPFPDGTFRPEAFVSREEGDAIFKRFGVTQ